MQIQSTHINRYNRVHLHLYTCVAIVIFSNIKFSHQRIVTSYSSYSKLAQSYSEMTDAGKLSHARSSVFMYRYVDR